MESRLASQTLQGISMSPNRHSQLWDNEGMLETVVHHKSVLENFGAA